MRQECLQSLSLSLSGSSLFVIISLVIFYLDFALNLSQALSVFLPFCLSLSVSLTSSPFYSLSCCSLSLSLSFTPIYISSLSLSIVNMYFSFFFSISSFFFSLSLFLSLDSIGRCEDLVNSLNIRLRVVNIALAL